MSISISDSFFSVCLPIPDFNCLCGFFPQAGLSHERNQPVTFKELNKKINAVSVTGQAGESLQLDEQVVISRVIYTSLL